MPLDFPVSYDQKVDIFGDILDSSILNLAVGCDDVETSLIFTQTAIVDLLGVPGYLTFLRDTFSGDFEIIKIVGKGGTGTGLLTVSRGALNTLPMNHIEGEQVAQDPVSEHLALLRTLLESAQKFQGLVGVSLPAACQPGECFINTASGQAYYAVAENTWEQLLYPDHSDYSGLDQDDHTNYQTEARKVTWHDDTTKTSGVHVNNPATHNHDGSSGMGAPASRFRHGLSSAKPNPTVANEVYFETNTGDLFLATGSPLAWTKYAPIPVGSIILFETDCPSGWSRFQLMDGRMPKGAESGEYQDHATGINSSHAHILPDILNHSHTIAEQSFSTSSVPPHRHTIRVFTGSGSGIYFANYPYLTTSTMSTVEELDHDHDFDVPPHDTSTTGEDAVYTDSVSHLSPYIKLVFCQKDE